MSMALLLAFIVLARQMSAYARCLTVAGPSTAQQSCQAQFTRAVKRELSTLRTAERG